jgi:hypothetical protein
VRNAYAVNYANGVLRRALGLERLPRTESSLGLYARLGLAAAHKYSGAQARRKAGRIVDFKLDPRAPQGVRPVPAFALGA